MEKLGEGTYATVYKVWRNFLFLSQDSSILHLKLIMSATSPTPCLGSISNYSGDCCPQGDSSGCRGRNTQYGDQGDQSDERSAGKWLFVLHKLIYPGRLCWSLGYLLSELKHPNIVRLHDVIHTETKLILIFEVSFNKLLSIEKYTDIRCCFGFSTVNTI